MKIPLLVLGGGTGGWAAAMAARDAGVDVVVSEETDWVGGQLTSQGVPSDEHAWIEDFGCTRRYRHFRNEVRRRSGGMFNPGSGWVSNLCVRPDISQAVLRRMDGGIRVFHRHRPVAAATHGDRVTHVTLRDERSGEEITFEPAYVIDATELGDLLPLAGIEHVEGTEGQSDTGEPNAPEEADPRNWQAVTWCFALGWDPAGREPIEPPPSYGFWRSYQPPFWPGPLLGWDDVNPVTLASRHLPLAGRHPSLFRYRQIVSAEHERYAVTAANWPMNDYFLCDPGADRDRVWRESRELSLSLLRWMQTEAPRHDGGAGYPELFLASGVFGTDHGFAMHPYVRESRRLRARFRITEPMVSAALNPGRDRASDLPRSVGVGAYRIDLHPSTGGDNYLDVSSLPFQIPLGALLPERVRNVLAGAKNIGTTHITNGCYRLHPVEWNIGEAAGELAAHCLATGQEPHAVEESDERFASFANRLDGVGVERTWPNVPLRAL